MSHLITHNHPHRLRERRQLDMSSDDQGIAALTPPADNHSGAGSPIDYSSPQSFYSPAAESSRRPSNGRSKYMFLCICIPFRHSSSCCSSCSPATVDLIPPLHGWCPVGKVMVMMCGVSSTPLARSVPYINQSLHRQTANTRKLSFPRLPYAQQPPLAPLPRRLPHLAAAAPALLQRAAQRGGAMSFHPDQSLVASLPLMSPLQSARPRTASRSEHSALARQPR